MTPDRANEHELRPHIDAILRDPASWLRNCREPKPSFRSDVDESLNALTPKQGLDLARVLYRVGKVQQSINIKGKDKLKGVKASLSAAREIHVKTSKRLRRLEERVGVQGEGRVKPAQPGPLCPICMDAKIDGVLGCGHTFCRGCIHDWLDDKPQCPNCRLPCDGVYLLYLP